MNHVSVSPTSGNGPTQGQRKTLTRVRIRSPLLTSTSHYTLIVKSNQNNNGSFVFLHCFGTVYMKVYPRFAFKNNKFESGGDGYP